MEDKVCSVKGCKSIYRVFKNKNDKKLYCGKHRQQLDKNNKCKECGCQFDVNKTKSDVNYYCKKHEKLRIIKIKICSICGSKIFVTKSLCRRHYLQFHRHGEILKNTIYEPNEFVINGNQIEIKIKTKNKLIRVVLINEIDFNLIKKHKWHIGNKGYAMTRHNNKLVLMHRMIMKPKDKEDIDHRNRNRLDNRRENLRIATKIINARNTKIRSDNKSGTVGVWYNKFRNKWSSYITVDKNRIILGRFKNKQDAIKVRKEAELKYWGEIIKR